MALSNSEGHLVLATGNKSELAVGYSTIYGDAVGGFAPIKDVPKTLGLGAGTLAQRAGRGSRADTPDPAELDHEGTVGGAATRAAGQRFAARLRRARRDPGPLRRAGGSQRRRDRGRRLRRRHWVERVAQQWSMRAEWKRRQYPPGTKISFKAFGRDRRVPIVSRWDGD